MIAILAATATFGSGLLFAVGGGSTPPDIAPRFIEACGGPNALIMVLPHAAATPETAGGSSAELLKKHGAKNVFIYQIAAPNDKQKTELLSKLKNVKGIWMGGGVQGRIIERFGKGWARKNFQAMYRRGVNFYGTSAGAMVMSDVMIYGPGEKPDTARIGPGLGLTTWVIDTHYAERNRQGRLLHALKESGMKNGIGIDERTWIVIRDNVIVERHAAATRPPRPPAEPPPLFR